MEGPSLFGGPYEYEGFCMWRACPSPPLSATRMRISASCLYIARCYFGNQLVLQSSDLEGSYNTDPGHGHGGSWCAFLPFVLWSKRVLDLNYVCAPRLLVLLVGACCLPRGWHLCWLCSPRFAFPMLYFPRPRLALCVTLSYGSPDR